MARKQQTVPSDVRKAIEPDQSLFKYSLFTLVGFLVIIATTSALLYTLLIEGSNKQLTATVFQSHAQSYANYFDLSQALLQNQLKHFGKEQKLVAALKKADVAQLAKLEQGMARVLPNLQQIKLFPVGSAMLKADELKLNLPEVDMINRAEKGDMVAAEARLTEDGYIVRLVQAVTDPFSDQTVGVILASFTLSAVTSQLDQFDVSKGSMELEQIFAGSKAQKLTANGAAINADASVVTLQLANPNWRVKFQPSAELTRENTLPSLAFWAPLAFATLATCICILIAYIRLRGNVRRDAMALVNFCRNLIAQEKSSVPEFKLSLFHSMARTLALSDHENVLGDENAGIGEGGKEAFDSSDPPISADMISVDIVEADDASTEEDILDLDLLDELENDELAAPEAPSPPPEEEKTTPAIAKKPQRDIPANIFRAYDIRGVMGETLDTEIAYLIGLAVGSQARAKDNKGVVVGADGRLSSPELCAALTQGLRDTGCDVINVGTVPTPLVYYGVFNSDAQSCVMITGSHNPPDYNGFKIVIDGETLANEAIQNLYQRIQQQDYSSGNGAFDEIDLVDHYCDRVTGDIALARPLKIVVDCGNGVASVIAPKLFEALGCEVIPLFCEVDGRFPNHHPDPGKPENLQDVITAVKEHGADLGVAFDGDGDRLGVVTNQGNIIYPDRLLMLFAKDVASRNPGADIIYDVKCSRRLAGLISNYGGRPIMWKTGHSLVKAKMRETGALLAGEMSGHIFFKERWFGFDDGIYSAARLLEILALDSRDADTVFTDFPDDLSTPEINIEVSEEEKFELVDKLKQSAQFDDADVSTIDGIRADFENGWGLVRASNTTPMLVLRFGAEDELALQQVQDRFKQELLKVESGLAIPF